jgi:hypothetical protein
VLAGLCEIGIVPVRTLKSEEQVGQVRIRGLSFLRPFGFVVERDRPLSPAAEAFVALSIGEGPQ